jgi:hypothetical protein
MANRYLTMNRRQRLMKSERAHVLTHKRILREDLTGMNSTIADKNYIAELAGRFNQAGFNDKQLNAILAALQTQYCSDADYEYSRRAYYTEQEISEGIEAKENKRGNTLAYARSALTRNMGKALERVLYGKG